MPGLDVFVIRFFCGLDFFVIPQQAQPLLCVTFFLLLHNRCWAHLVLWSHGKQTSGWASPPYISSFPVSQHTLLWKDKSSPWEFTVVFGSSNLMLLQCLPFLQQGHKCGQGPQPDNPLQMHFQLERWTQHKMYFNPLIHQQLFFYQ